MAELSAEERAEMIIHSFAEDTFPEWVNQRLHTLITVEIRDAASDAARQERARCAVLLETKQVISSSVPPHWRLIDDPDPDVLRRMYAAAIRALPDG